MTLHDAMERLRKAHERWLGGERRTQVEGTLEFAAAALLAAWDQPPSERAKAWREAMDSNYDWLRAVNPPNVTALLDEAVRAITHAGDGGAPTDDWTQRLVQERDVARGEVERLRHENETLWAANKRMTAELLKGGGDQGEVERLRKENEEGVRVIAAQRCLVAELRATITQCNEFIDKLLDRIAKGAT